jgi:hypothetical protein
MGNRKMVSCLEFKSGVPIGSLISVRILTALFRFGAFINVKIWELLCINNTTLAFCANTILSLPSNLINRASLLSHVS